MNDLPRPATHLESLVVRTDFSDDAAWVRVCGEIEAPNPDEGFSACVQFVSDPDYAGASVDEVVAVGRRGPALGVLFVIDHMALTHEEYPVLAIDLEEEPGRTLRVVPRWMWAVQNNIAVCNMLFSEFADEADADGIYRG